MSNQTAGAYGALRVAPDALPLPMQAAPAGCAELVLAGGCFWCTEAVFAALDGVRSVESGYAGGSAETANYERVCRGDTEHAEAIRIRFDPARVDAGMLLQLFFAVAHDPTQKDRQGHDRGRQYRSAVFWHDVAERDYVAGYIEQLNRAGVFTAPIETTLEPLSTFYPAEVYHQSFAARNPTQPYVQAVALPKLEKLQHFFAEVTKSIDDKKGDQMMAPTPLPSGPVPAQSAAGFSLAPLSAEERERRAASLTTDERRVLLEHGTERPFCGGLLDNKQDGTYLCRLCELPLFGSSAKFDSGTGWPSFFAPFDPHHIRYIKDMSHGMVRIEIRCQRCDSHLGHVFPDGPLPSGWRFCLNSVAMQFESD